jgi:hypothetical protein
MLDTLSVTKTSYTVVDFLEWQRQGSLELRPFYQRRSVWNPRTKSLLIDSLIRGFPLPLIFLHSRLDVATSKSIRQVVDGQQRLRTILSFIDIDCIEDAEEWDRFTVLRSHNATYAGLSFQQFPDDIQTLVLQTPLSVNVLPADIDDVTVLTIFQRMNSTGLKLNAQEIRNASYFGEFKDSAYQLAYEQYHRWIGWQLFNIQDLAQMQEVELTSDLMGLLVRGVAARSRATLDALYKSYDKTFPERGEVEQRFRETFDFLDAVYASDATRSGIRRFRSSAWFYAIFALASRSKIEGVTPGQLSALTPVKLVSHLEAAEVRLRSPEGISEDVLKVLRGATADRRSRIVRAQFILQS